MKSPSDAEARELLKSHNLRVTAPRLAVLRALQEVGQPISHQEMVEHLADATYDPATLYRNLVRLSEEGIAPIVSHAGGVDRYALAEEGDGHRHPHFVCNSCGLMKCLELSAIVDRRILGARWSDSLDDATVQLQGECPDCRKKNGKSRRRSSKK